MSHEPGNETNGNPQTPDTSSPEPRAWLLLLGMVFVVLTMSQFTGRVSGKGSGGAQMGCGGALPPSSTSKAPATFGTSKNYLTATIEAVGDTYIRKSNAGPYGSENKIAIKNENGGTSSNVRKGLVKFTVNTADAYRSVEAALEMVFVSQGVEATFAFNIYGLKTGSGCSANDFNESTVLYNQIPVVDSSSDGVVNTHSCLFRSARDTSSEPPVLVSVLVPMSMVGQTVSFASNALTEYIQYQAQYATGDTTTIAFLITRVDEHSAWSTFASKEHGSYHAPRLRMTYQAPNDTLTATGDTYLQYDNSGPYGANSTMVVKKDDGNGSTTRLAMFKFRVNNAETKKNPYAEIQLAVSGHNMASATYFVWGLKTGVGCMVNDFNEATVKSSHIGLLDNSGDGVDNSHPCLYTTSKLGSFTVTSGQVGQTVIFASQKMAAYLLEQVNQSTGNTTVVTFLISREQADASPSYFASKEHSSLHPPRLKFTGVVPGSQSVCGQTCTNCPQKAFTATCTLTDNYATFNGSVYGGQTLRQLKVTTMGKTINLWANWSDISDNGRKSYQTSGVVALRTSQGNIPLTPLGGQALTVTCEPYLDVKSQLGSLPGLPGINSLAIDNLASTPSLSLGVRLGTHLKEDYPTTPFNSCVPYFFIAVDTAMGAGNYSINEQLGLAELNFLLAFDPDDPSFITEVGGAPVTAATGDTIENIGFGASWNGKMQWTSAVPVPKSIAEFDTLASVSINGHLYGHIGFTLPVGIKPKVDADVFFDMSPLGPLTKTLVNDMHNGIFKKDMLALGAQTLNQIELGFNINSVDISIPPVFEFSLGSGSYVRKGSTTRFAGFLKTPSASTPKWIDDASPAIYNFANKIFDPVNNAANANIEVKGVVELDTLTAPKFRVSMTAKGKFAGLFKSSVDVNMTLGNTNTSGGIIDPYGKLSASVRFHDFTNYMTSASFDLQGDVGFSTGRGVYSNLSGSTSLTVGSYQVAGVNVSFSNQNVIDGKVTVSGTLNTPVISASVSGSTSTLGGLSLSGSASVNLTPVMDVVALGATAYLSAVSSAYSCLPSPQQYAQCGWNYITVTVTNVGSCVSSIKCKKSFLGVCYEWTCTVKDGYKSCYKCRKKENKQITLPSVNTSVDFTLSDSPNPLSGSVSILSGAVSGAAASLEVATGHGNVCYAYPLDYVKNKAVELLSGVGLGDIYSVVTKYCRTAF